MDDEVGPLADLFCGCRSAARRRNLVLATASVRFANEREHRGLAIAQRFGGTDREGLRARFVRSSRSDSVYVERAVSRRERRARMGVGAEDKQGFLRRERQGRQTREGDLPSLATREPTRQRE